MSLLVEGKIMQGIMLVIFTIVFFWMRNRVLQGHKIELKRLVYFDALEEAVGRATEMNRPVIVQTGSVRLESYEGISVVASMGLVNYVAQRCARLGTNFFYLGENPSHLPLALDAIRSAYQVEGKLPEFEANVEEIVRYSRGTHTLATYFREKPAAIFITGSFGNTSVWYGEGAARVGAISLGGTFKLVQNPFTVVCYDYPLIGEENIVMAAYISRDPISLSTLAAQDFWKIAAVILMIVGCIAITFGSDIVEAILSF
jgi:hypothetical protein